MRARRSMLPMLVGLASVGVMVFGLGEGSAQARDLYPVGGSFTFACENGANYVLHAGSITTSGDVVTGHLHLSPRHSVQVRLIPMGVGYRYAGRGVWVDGVRERAVIYLRKNSPVACSVASA